MRAAWSFALVVAVGLVACRSKESVPERPELDPARELNSEHFVYRSRPSDETVCPAALNSVERHFDVMQKYLGFEWPAGKKIEYFKFEDSDDLRKHGTCSSFNAACFYASIGIQTREPITLHELIHAYLSPLGRRHTLLEEGLAESLSCAHEVYERPKTPDVETAFDSETWASNSVKGYREMYAAARWFVGWLLREHGPARFMSFYRALAPGDEFTQAKRAFDAAYGSDLTSAWQVAFDSTNLDTACARIWECAQSDWFADPISTECGDSPLRSLKLDTAQWVIQRSSGSLGMHVGSCDGAQLPHDEWLTEAADGQSGEVFALLLDRGHYFVTQSPDFGPGEIELFNFDQGVATPDSCSDAIPLRVDFRQNLTIAVPPQASTIALPRGPEAGEKSNVLTMSWLDENRTGRGYKITCSSDSSEPEPAREPNDAGAFEASTWFAWCSDCTTCSDRCDTNVVFPELGLAEGLRVVALNAGAKASWVRFSRTF